jgi:hypothetical protein
MISRKYSDYPEISALPAGSFLLAEIAAGVYRRISKENLEVQFGSGGSGGGGGTTLVAPTLSAAGIDADTIRLTIGTVANETSIEIQRSNDGSTGWTTINTAAANTTTYDDNGLAASTTRHYRVRSVGDGVTYLTSPWSSVANGTTSAAGGATYLTFPSFPSGFEAYNSNKGVRTTGGYAEAWTGILANETLAVGQRLVVKTDGIGKFSFFGVSSDGTTSGGWSPNTGGRQTDESKIEASNLDTAFNEAINDNYFYSVLYESEDNASPADNGVIRLQKSADGTSWTTIASATSTPFAGNLFIKIFIYSANHGFSEIYKL